MYFFQDRQFTGGLDLVRGRAFRHLFPGTIDFRVERLQLFLASTDIVRHDIGIWRPNSMEPWQTASTLSLMQHEGGPENRLRIRPFSGRLLTRNNTVKT